MAPGDDARQEAESLARDLEFEDFKAAMASVGVL
jgi:hypothetical protein